MPTDYYSVLGVDRDASETDIKRAYRGLARKYHPDVAEDKTSAESRFKEINEAYEILSDPAKRQHYDRFGSVQNGAGGGAGGFGGGFSSGEGIGDIFDMFFGGARGGGQQRAAGPERGSDLRYDLQITLEEAFSGVEREIAFTHLGQCTTCSGSGAKPGTLVSRCDRCGGSGAMRSVRQTPLGQFVTQTTCTKCGGEGTFIPTPCETCRGRGRVERPRSLTVKIPAGVDDGSRIRVSGSGEGGTRGGPPGDLYVYLSIAPHRVFRREGNDLLIDVPIGFAQAALGASFDVDSLDGATPLTIGPGTQTGSLFRIRGRGMPTVRGSSRGDLLATVHVAVPTRLTRRGRELLEEYAAIEAEHDDKTFFDRVKDAFRPE
ncbi:MAG: molecular chaperone DnaJ [Candidatus Eremiobacteraeota bacterium]|nr:molecular chaperone DnaJ [Candidatus Eremiobacteraeota bacterium]